MTCERPMNEDARRLADRVQWQRSLEMRGPGIALEPNVDLFRCVQSYRPVGSPAFPNIACTSAKSATWRVSRRQLTGGVLASERTSFRCREPCFDHFSSRRTVPGLDNSFRVRSCFRPFPLPEVCQPPSHQQAGSSFRRQSGLSTAWPTGLRRTRQPELRERVLFWAFHSYRDTDASRSEVGIRWPAETAHSSASASLGSGRPASRLRSVT